MNALTLFGDQPAEPPAPKPIEGIKWDSYRSKNAPKCHHCVLALVTLKGEAPVARSARFRRRTATSDELLCYEHARQQRQIDGLPDLRAPRA
jgi:hypothetical protein